MPSSSSSHQEHRSREGTGASAQESCRGVVGTGQEKGHACQSKGWEHRKEGRSEGIKQLAQQQGKGIRCKHAEESPEGAKSLRSH